MRLSNQQLNMVSFIKTSFNNVFFYLLLVDIKLIYFVTKTTWGYSLYLSALAVIYGTKTHEPGFFFLLCFLFSSYVLSAGFFLLVLVKTPVTRKYMRHLFGEEYLVKHLGAKMMTREFGKLVTGVVLVIIGEKTTESWDRSVNHQEADAAEMRQKELWRNHGYTPTMKEDQAVLDQTNAIRLKQPRGLGDHLWDLIKRKSSDQ